MRGAQPTLNALKDLLEVENLVDGSTAEIPNVVKSAATGRHVQAIDSSRGGGEAVTVVYFGFPPIKAPYKTADYMDPTVLRSDVVAYLETGRLPPGVETIL